MKSAQKNTPHIQSSPKSMEAVKSQIFKGNANALGDKNQVVIIAAPRTSSTALTRTLKENAIHEPLFSAYAALAESKLTRQNLSNDEQEREKDNTVLDTYRNAAALYKVRKEMASISMMDTNGMDKLTAEQQQKIQRQYSQELMHIAETSQYPVIFLTSDPISMLHSTIKSSLHKFFSKNPYFNATHKSHRSALKETIKLSIAYSKDTISDNLNAIEGIKSYLKYKGHAFITLDKETIKTQPEAVTGLISKECDIESDNDLTLSTTISRQQPMGIECLNQNTVNNFPFPHYYMTYDDKWTSDHDRQSSIFRPKQKATSERVQNLNDIGEKVQGSQISYKKQRKFIKEIEKIMAEAENEVIYKTLTAPPPYYDAGIE